MIEPREKLRLLYFVSIYQPIDVGALRLLYLRSTKEPSPFAALMKELREEMYLSNEDPISCTANGQAMIQALPLRKGRDIARMFHLKKLAEGAKIKLASDG